MSDVPCDSGSVHMMITMIVASSLCGTARVKERFELQANASPRFAIASSSDGYAIPNRVCLRTEKQSIVQ